MFEALQIGLSIGLAVVSIIVAFIGFIKNKKTQKVSAILAKIPNYIIEAETIFGGGTGKAKLAYVLNKIQVDCVKANINISEEVLTQQIENVMETPQKKQTEV